MGARRAVWRAAIVGLLIAVCPFRSAGAQTEAPSGVTGIGSPDVIPTEDTLDTTFGLSMGAGVRAAAIGTSALAYNTSNMAALSTYHVEAFSQIIPGSKSNGGTYWTLGSSITDSTTAKRFALGTSFRGAFSGQNRRYSGWDWRTGLGVQVIPQLGLGLGIRWARLNASRFEGQRIGPSFNGITMDASVTITPVPMLKLAGLGYNLIRTYSVLAPRMAGGSIAVMPIDELTVGGDVLADLSTFESTKLIGGVGASYIAGEMVPIRLGYRRDGGRDLNQITAGLGFTRNKIAFEGALRQDVSGRKETYLIFMFRFVVQ